MVKKAAVIFGIVLIVIGILGFIPGITQEGMLFGLFRVNAAHNWVHLITGAIAVWTGTASFRAARLFFVIFGVVYALLAVLGFVVGRDMLLGFVAHNMADAWLHVVIAVVALYFGFASSPKVKA